MMNDNNPHWVTGQRGHDEDSQVHGSNVSVARRQIFLHPSHDSEDGDPGTDWRMAGTFIKNMNILQSSGESAIEVHQFNIGGDEESGYAIYDSSAARVQLLLSPMGLRLLWEVLYLKLLI